MTLLQDFPIQGSLREPLLILESLIFFLFFEQAFILLIRIRNRKDLKSLQEKAYIWLFLGYAGMWLFIIISDFYIYNNSIQEIIINIGFLTQIIFLSIFFKTMESYKVYIKKYLFTKTGCIAFACFILISFIDLSLASYVSSTFWIIFIIFFIIYFKDLNLNLYLKKDIIDLKFEIIKFFLSVLIIAIGYQFTTRFIVNIFGVPYRFLGDILQLIGSFLLAWFFIKVPSFTEYVWQDKIESIFIIHKSGLLLYSKKFREISDDLYDSVISGRLTMLKMILEKTMSLEGPSVIEKEGKIILFHPGKYIYGILICDEILKSHQILLIKLIEKIEQIYLKVLEEWRGNLKNFLSIDNIVKEIFF